MLFRALTKLGRRQRESVIRRQVVEGAKPGADCHFWLGAKGVGRLDICAMMMVKDEGDIIFENIAWHLRLGFRHFVISDSGSTDNTRERIEAVRRLDPDARFIIVEDTEIAFAQDRKMSGLARLVQSRWPAVRWIFPIDADEFLCAKVDIDVAIAWLDMQRTEIVYIPYYNAGEAADGGTVDEANPFYRRLIYHKMRIEDFKVAFRSGNVKLVHNGNHDVDLNTNWQRRAGGLDAGLIYRHFPARGPKHLRRKIINGGQSIEASDYPEYIAFHWRQWYARFRAEGDAALLDIYDEMRIPPETAVLAPFPLDDLLDLPGTGRPEPARD